MTRDELLLKIAFSGDTSLESTLRAIVEYHEPFEFTWGQETETTCYCGEMYPCPTIKRIIEELE